MLQTCTQCGAINEEHADFCSFCDARLVAQEEEVPASVSVSARTEGSLAVAPDWRREVAHRLAAYRARRRRLRSPDSQTALPFSDASGATIVEPEPERAAVFARTGTAEIGAAEPAQDREYSRRSVERVEIEVTQPELDFAAEGAPRGLWPREGAAGNASVLPVAELGERRRAALLDAAFLLLAYGGFLALFRLLGGQFSFGKFDGVVYAAALVVLYAQYFALFTLFGGSTPGMLIRGLRVVSFDGGAPAPRQLLWRSFGYLVSGGTFLLGFLWALWDEDHLTWQDRISQTYLTSAATSPPPGAGSCDERGSTTAAQP